MNFRAVPALIGVAALALATALAGPASAQDSSKIAVTSTAVQGTTSAPLEGKICKGADYTGAAIASVTDQDFGAGFENLDSFGAQPFKLTKKCKVKSVYVDGSGGVPSSGLNVWIYKLDASGLPNKDEPVCEDVITGYDGPVFKVPFRCKLKKGSYAFAAQNSLDFAQYGQWFWNMRAAVADPVSAWKNPGGGFGSSCATWGFLLDCLDFGPYDYIFALQKGSVD